MQIHNTTAKWSWDLASLPHWQITLSPLYFPRNVYMCSCIMDNHSISRCYLAINLPWTRPKKWVDSHNKFIENRFLLIMKTKPVSISVLSSYLVHRIFQCPICFGVKSIKGAELCTCSTGIHARGGYVESRCSIQITDSPTTPSHPHTHHPHDRMTEKQDSSGKLER